MVRGSYEAAGAAGAALKNVVHGVWLGHPLHPVLTDIPVGAWTTALVLDSFEASTGDEAYGRGADIFSGVGTAAAAEVQARRAVHAEASAVDGKTAGFTEAGIRSRKVNRCLSCTTRRYT